MARRRRIDRNQKQRRERRYRLQAKTTRFIPDADRDFAHMARTFAEYCEQHAERFRLSPAQVEELAHAVAEFRTALARSMEPRTCGPFATRQKNTARAKARNTIRAVAAALRGLGRLNGDAVLTPSDRLMLNINERSTKLKRRECPDIAPVLVFKGSTSPDSIGGKHILEYRNDFGMGSEKGAKPHGVARLELFVELVPPTEPVPSHPGERSGGKLWYLRSYSTSRFEVEFPMLSDGTPMRVCYWGRWADACGGTGKFSQTCVARVEGSHLMLPGDVNVAVFDERHRRKNVIAHLPHELEAKVVVEYGARHALPAGDDELKQPPAIALLSAA